MGFSGDVFRKSEARSPKFETNPNFQNVKIKNNLFETLGHSSFGFVSYLDIRISDLIEAQRELEDSCLVA
jgi:hypothetical protein